MPTATPSSPRAHIGVFDSGVGGLSVLRALRQHLPGADFTYLADSFHAPYGEKPAEQVQARSRAIAEWLRAQGAQLLVVACNTATAHAIEALRDELAPWPIVGVEPGIKPALAQSRNGRVAVLATPGTLASDRFARLLRAHDPNQQVQALPCPGLAGAIEQADPVAAGLPALLDRTAQRVRETGADTVVLGCTHYPFVADELAQRLGSGVQLLDTAEAIARRVASLLPPSPQAPTGQGRLRLCSTGEPTTLQRLAARWLDHPQPAQVLAL
jgi:glutamate racemase